MLCPIELEVSDISSLAHQQFLNQALQTNEGFILDRERFLLFNRFQVKPIATWTQQH
jgi:hypothetical protein